MSNRSSSPHHDRPSEEAAHSFIVKATFFDKALPYVLQNATDEQLDRAPFGIIRIDRRGVVQFYNRFEARFSGQRTSEVLGRHFFDDVAPCTRNRLFRTRFERGLVRKELDVIFSYTFTYRLRPTAVKVRMLLDPEEQAWIAIRPKASTGA
jgi:photoactive yellow protein